MENDRETEDENYQVNNGGEVMFTEAVKEEMKKHRKKSLLSQEVYQLRTTKANHSNVDLQQEIYCGIEQTNFNDLLSDSVQLNYCDEAVTSAAATVVEFVVDGAVEVALAAVNRKLGKEHSSTRLVYKEEEVLKTVAETSRSKRIVKADAYTETQTFGVGTSDDYTPSAAFLRLKSASNTGTTSNKSSKPAKSTASSSTSLSPIPGICNASSIAAAFASMSDNGCHQSIAMDAFDYSELMDDVKQNLLDEITTEHFKNKFLFDDTISTEAVHQRTCSLHVNAAAIKRNLENFRPFGRRIRPTLLKVLAPDGSDYITMGTLKSIVKTALDERYEFTSEQIEGALRDLGIPSNEPIHYTAFLDLIRMHRGQALSRIEESKLGEWLKVDDWHQALNRVGVTVTQDEVKNALDRIRQRVMEIKRQEAVAITVATTTTVEESMLVDNDVLEELQDPRDGSISRISWAESYGDFSSDLNSSSSSQSESMMDEEHILTTGRGTVNSCGVTRNDGAAGGWQSNMVGMESADLLENVLQEIVRNHTNDETYGKHEANNGSSDSEHSSLEFGEPHVTRSSIFDEGSSFCTAVTGMSNTQKADIINHLDSDVYLDVDNEDDFVDVTD